MVEAIVKEIKAAGGRAVADHSTPDQAGTLIQTAIDNFGRVDILLYSATTENSPVWQQTSQEDWDSLLNPEFKLSYKVGICPTIGYHNIDCFPLPPDGPCSLATSEEAEVWKDPQHQHIGWARRLESLTSDFRYDNI